MPELPEVQTVVNTLLPQISGQLIRSVKVARADIISPARFDICSHLLNRRISDVTRRGKKIVFTLDDGNRFVIHLGMTGRLTMENYAAPILPHTHLMVDIASMQMRFVDPRRFGGLFWLGTEVTENENLGPEPLEMSASDLADRLGRTKRAIKNVLLDQSVVAGLGNIYVDESLFASQIHPLTPADELTAIQISRLTRAIKTVLRRALKHRGSTLRDYRDADGNPGNFQKLHRVYQRTGEPCPVCKTPIGRLVLGGRSSHFCPKCQKTANKSRRSKSAT